MATADLKEMHRSKVTNLGNGVKTFWMRFHGYEIDIEWSDGKWTAATGFAHSGNKTNQTIVVGTQMRKAADGNTAAATSGYFCQSVDYDPRPDNMPGRVISTVVWRKFGTYS